MTPVLVLVTAKDEAEGRVIAQALLEGKLAACVNLIPGVESHYWWEGKIQQDREVLLVIKSSEEKWEALVVCIKSTHSYETPEMIRLAPDAVESSYLAWWQLLK